MNTHESVAILPLSSLPAAALANELHKAAMNSAAAAMPAQLLNLAQLCRSGVARSHGLASIAIRASERGEVTMDDVECMASLAEELKELFATIAGETHEIASRT